MNQSHPYKEFERTKAWKALSKGIRDLQANGDIEEKTARHYIVGYLAKLLYDADLLSEAGPPPEDSPKPRRVGTAPQGSRAKAP